MAMPFCSIFLLHRAANFIKNFWPGVEFELPAFESVHLMA